MLVVEDDLDNKDLLVFALEAEGAQVTAVESAQQALEILEHTRPSIMLCDIALPGENGYSLIKSWREREAILGVTPIPAIAVTAFVRDQDKQNALAAGFDLHVSKPIDIDQVPQIITELIRSRVTDPQSPTLPDSDCIEAS